MGKDASWGRWGEVLLEMTYFFFLSFREDLGIMGDFRLLVIDSWGIARPEDYLSLEEEFYGETILLTRRRK